MVVLNCPCGEGSRPSSKGYVTASWLDRVDDRTVRVTRVLPRVTCRCGRSSTSGVPTLEAGHRMTPAVADAIFRDTLTTSFVDVARTHLTNRTTVSDVHAGRMRVLSRRRTPEPRMLALRSRGGGSSLILACEARGAPYVVDAFTGTGDPRLGALLDARLGRIHADWETGCAVLARWPSARVTIVRASCLAWMWETMRSCVSLLRAGLDRAGCRVLAEVEAAIVTPPYGTSIAEAAALEAACRSVPDIRRFVGVRDRLASCLAQTDVTVARPVLEELLGDPSATRWFRPVIRALVRMAAAILNDGFGRVSCRTWSEIVALHIDDVPGEPASRAVARHLYGSSRRSMPSVSRTPALAMPVLRT